MSVPPEAPSTLRILHVTQPVDGGVAAVVADLAAHQAADGHRVAVASPDGWVREQLAPDVDWHRWSSTRQPGRSLPGEARALARIVRDVEPDAVHLHSSKAGLVGRLVIRGRRPTVFQPHAWSFHAAGGAQRLLSRWWERAGARWTSLLLACSGDELREGMTAGVAVPARVVLNGVRTPSPAALDVDRARIRAELGVTDDVPVLAVVGRLCVQKGQDVLLDAWPAIRRAHPRAVLVLAGDGPERAALQARATSGVTFLGHRPDALRVIAAADLVVAPSRWEGLSLSLLEAMSCGRPVVSGDVSGAAGALRAGSPEAAGIVVPVGDPAALGDAVVELLGSPQRCRAMGARGRERVGRRYRREQTFAAATQSLAAAAATARARTVTT